MPSPSLRDGLVGEFPHLEWPRVRRTKPDPFEPTERDRIIAWFERESPAFAPWVKFLFWTGVRPGEAAALRWSDVDLRRGVVAISRSRDEREENEPKTVGSSRAVPLLPGALEALRALPHPLHSSGNEFVFLTPERKPMTDTWWPKQGATRKPKTDAERGLWYRCLTSLGIRPRKAYTTRHTFMAWACSEGANLKALAEYCGTSVAMVEQSYARFIGSDFLASLIASSNARKEPEKLEVRLPAVRGWRRGKLNRLRNQQPNPRILCELKDLQGRSRAASC